MPVDRAESLLWLAEHFTSFSVFVAGLGGLGLCFDSRAV
jgi:hypothetical protein